MSIYAGCVSKKGSDEFIPKEDFGHARQDSNPWGLLIRSQTVLHILKIFCVYYRGVYLPLDDLADEIESIKWKKTIQVNC